MITWIIGMSGSGKTTLGRMVYKYKKEIDHSTVFLDGDDIRDILQNDVDHSVEGRYKNAARISHMCKFFDKQEIHVVASVLSIFPEWQEWNRENFKEYFEIYLDVSMQELIKRDPKGLYKLALEGKMKNFVGFDIDFPVPKNADLIINEEQMKKGVDNTFESIKKKLP
jgi:cytidine diphosphoramidate kinase